MVTVQTVEMYVCVCVCCTCSSRNWTITVTELFSRRTERRKTSASCSDGLMHVAAWRRRTTESKFTKFGEEMSIGQTPNHAKFCGDPTRNVRDSRDQKFVLPEKVG